MDTLRNQHPDGRPGRPRPPAAPIRRLNPGSPRPTGLLLAFALVLAGCGVRLAAQPGPPAAEPASPSASGAGQPVTDVFIWVEVPADTPPGAAVQLEMLDEVTGLPFNPVRTLLRAVDATHYGAALRVPVGSALKYRFLRVDSGGGRVPEVQSDGQPVRCRLFFVDGPGEVHDIVARWKDTPLLAAPGRIAGRALDAQTRRPIPGLLALAGGRQTLTLSDGAFLLDGLPPGTHQVTLYAPDGSYRPAKHNARVASEAATPALLALDPLPLVEVTFEVTVPDGLPPGLPLRLAGNLSTLGNTFSDLGGGISGLAAAMPVLTQQRGNRYSVTLDLPAGAEILYKYTLGDGFWNAEHGEDGGFVVRRLLLPANPRRVTLHDEALTFQAGPGAPVWFDAQVHAFTPPGDVLYIQFRLDDWLAPLPMTPVRDGRWAWVLLGPTNIGGNLVYRYCRNALCGGETTLGIALEPDQRSVATGAAQSLVQVDHISRWQRLDPPAFAATVLDNPVQPRRGFTAGVLFAPAHAPAWDAFMLDSLAAVQNLHANTLILSPTWEAGGSDLPRLEARPGLDPTWAGLTRQIQLARGLGLRVALAPQPRLAGSSEAWWAQARRDGAWWRVWFEQYRAFALHHADLAEQAGADALLLGGGWVTPALPGGAEDTPADSGERWAALLAEVRARFGGELGWQLPFAEENTPAPAFLRDVDVLYVEWGAALGAWEGATLPEMQSRAAQLLRQHVQPLAERHGLPVVLVALYPSALGGLTNCIPADSGCLPPERLWPWLAEAEGVPLSLGEQMEVYNALLAAVSEAEWLDGFVSAGYFPPAALQDKSPSVHGKPAEDVLRYWFARLLGK
jgi:hypothetical protein